MTNPDPHAWWKMSLQILWAAAIVGAAVAIAFSVGYHIARLFGMPV